MAKTIDEIKKAKIILESSILKLIQKFEEDNEVRITYVETMRKRPKSTKDGYHPCQCMPEDSYDDQPLENVDLNLRFDI